MASKKNIVILKIKDLAKSDPENKGLKHRAQGAWARVQRPGKVISGQEMVSLQKKVIGILKTKNLTNSDPENKRLSWLTDPRLRSETWGTRFSAKKARGQKSDQRSGNGEPQKKVIVILKTKDLTNSDPENKRT